MMQRDKKYIAFVCTGNTCRSPMAEAIFNKLAEEKELDVRAESFGIATDSGLSISQNSKDVCDEIGIDLSNAKSTAINDADLNKFEKFYCMSQSHILILKEYYNIPAEKLSVMGVADPYGGDIAVYRNCREQIYNSIKEIIRNYEN